MIVCSIFCYHMFLWCLCESCVFIWLNLVWFCVLTYVSHVFVFCILAHFFNVCMSLVCLFLQTLCDCVFVWVICDWLCLDINAHSSGPFSIYAHFWVAYLCLDINFSIKWSIWYKYSFLSGLFVFRCKLLNQVVPFIGAMGGEYALAK